MSIVSPVYVIQSQHNRMWPYHDATNNTQNLKENMYT